LAQGDLVLLEGAGGWRVPLNSRETLADLAKNLRLPVIMVVGMRLGCINHALLTYEAIVRDGLPLAAWVANCVDADMPALEENIQTLRAGIAAPCLGVIPFLAQPSPDRVAGCFEASEVQKLMF
jgi:dethiobiotin synthetase